MLKVRNLNSFTPIPNYAKLRKMAVVSLAELMPLKFQHVVSLKIFTYVQD